MTIHDLQDKHIGRHQGIADSLVFPRGLINGS